MLVLLGAMKKKAIKDFFSSRTRQTRKRLDELKREKKRIEICCQGLEKKLRDFELRKGEIIEQFRACLLYTSPSPRDRS